MFRFVQVTGIAVFCLLLGGPLVGYFALGAETDSFEQRRPAELPGFAWSRLLHATFYTGVDAFVNDHIPGRSFLIRADSWIDYHLLGDSPTPEVVLGRDGWLFWRSELEGQCGAKEAPEAQVARLAESARLFRTLGKDFLLLLCPVKSAIYPELLSETAEQLNACSAARRERLHEALGQIAAAQYPDLFSLFEERRFVEGEPLFPSGGFHWGPEGSLLFAEATVEALQPGLWDPDAVVRGKTSRRNAELPQRFMHLTIEEPHPGLLIRREGITVESEIDDEAGWKRYRTSAPPGSVVEGRTVVLHDSFMEWPKRLIAPYLRDSTFIGWQRVVGRDPAAAALRADVYSADTVIFQMVETNLSQRIRDLRRLDLRARAKPAAPRRSRRAR